LTDDVRARLGPIAQRQLLSLGVQARKLREDLSSIFNNVRVDGMLGGIRKVTELFSQSTATGRALRTLAESFLQPLADSIEGVSPLVRDFFRGMVLAALEFAIAIQEVRLWLRNTFGDSKILATFRSLRVAFNLGRAILAVLAGAFGLLATA